MFFSQFDKVALSSFFEDGPGDAGIADLEEVLPAEEATGRANVNMGTQSGPHRLTAKPPASNFATLSSLNANASSDEDDDQKGEAFYAGGSEHSGQQILGPPKKKTPVQDYISEVFRTAQAGNMEQFDSGSSSSSNESAPRQFVGTGYRLGQTDSDHVAIPSAGAGAGAAGRRPRQECDTVTVRVWRQGFTVDDGELRPYDVPRNREFFECITRNEIPAELRKQGTSMIHVNVEDHLSEDYVKKTPKFKAFAGSGHTLGNPAPETTQGSEVVSTNKSTTPAATGDTAINDTQATTQLNLDESSPLTMVSVRLADGTRLSLRFNLSHTIQDIRRYIET